MSFHENVFLRLQNFEYTEFVSSLLKEKLFAKKILQIREDFIFLLIFSRLILLFWEEILRNSDIFWTFGEIL